MDNTQILLQTIQSLTDTNSKQLQEITALNDELKRLNAQLAWFTRQMFGKKSEKLGPFDPNQLSLNFSGVDPEEPTLQAAVDAAKEVAEQELSQISIKKEEKARRKNRSGLDNLPIIEVIVEPEGLDLNKYIRIGEERTRTLEFEPGKLYVKEIIRPKYGLKSSKALENIEAKPVLIAPLPLLPIYKGLPGATLLAEILLQKYVYHLPFYRQQQQLKHLGMELPESTLNGWFKPACELLRPLYDQLKKDVLDCDYVQVDETTLPVIDKEKKKAKKEYLWIVRSVMKNSFFFHYDSGSRSGKVALDLLTNFRGYLQSDGYQGYNVFEDKASVRLVGCLAHARRKFIEAKDENEALASYVLGQIQLLYKIERSADQDNLNYDQRADVRKRLALPIWDALEKWMEAVYPTVLPKSRIGEAIAYTYARVPRLKEYAQDGRILIDNNGVENALRPLAISRKNFLFCGNHASAEQTAIICSLLGCCKAADVNPREWLIDVLGKLPYYTQPGAQKEKELVDLLPINWAKSNKNLTIV